ncbi:cAMP-binding domain of CRP or a regulatory subunit of cAMP-dependent protein kinases [Reichenbachiella agariperforans]|uniref:cAMP-binding domain of CRP or a regulatory subunit of cAMP-dependent protein kinases n=1 Tax=Reichenbachiella agariperforans TaxID=156994 RepID=A0A1M6SZR2_REIAG|nr:Crp/Fnr family transcriptional regulator [Reichenbachiella agariperforans]SHK50038.1 cAMP-binding domain of CRP or a regulatory subunit of cAMP-dependent protein kinases [Reichenbachiella agariperforans]
MKDRLKEFLTKLDTFSYSEVNAIVDATSVKHFKKGTVLLKEGQICRSCYYVLDGCIRQYQLKNGTEKTTTFFTEGQAAVLYTSYMEGTPSEYYLSCVEDAVLTCGTYEEEQKLHDQFPKLKYLVNTLMTQDFIVLQKRLSSMINQTPEERYLNILNSQPELLQKVPLHHLAGYIGVTPESFSRIRKRLTDKLNIEAI